MTMKILTIKEIDSVSWSLIRVKLPSVSLHYFSAIDVDVGDVVVAETSYGTIKGVVEAIDKVIEENPFSSKQSRYKASKRILENATKHIYERKDATMLGMKTVEVQHMNSSRIGVFYTCVPVRKGDIVLYEGHPFGKDQDNLAPFNMSLHVGVVVNDEPEVITADRLVIAKVDMAAYHRTKQNMKKAKVLRAKLDAKKKQFQDIELLRLIAANDPDTKQMLDEYLALTNPQEGKSDEKN